MNWNEYIVGGALCRQVFNRTALVVVPNCNWTGHECDILVVEKGLRLIDVEIKVSRADLRADIKKDKWWRRLPPRRWDYDTKAWAAPPPALRNEWPPKIWKHYYALPATVWAKELVAQIPAVSGVILLHERGGLLRMEVERRAKPNSAAKPVDAGHAIDIARLASLRMWDTYAQWDAYRKNQAPPKPEEMP